MKTTFECPRIVARGVPTPSEWRATASRPPVALTDVQPPPGRGTHNDYHSDADYWWPSPSGGQFKRRDGESYPDAFIAHRAVIWELKWRVSTLAFYYAPGTATEGPLVEQLDRFFVDPQSRMTPHFRYSQAIGGRNTGRSQGLIDGLHLCETAVCIWRLRTIAPGVRVFRAAAQWCGQFLDYLLTDPWALRESERENNHASAYWLMVASMCIAAGREAPALAAARWFVDVLLGQQMDDRGFFRAELARSKPLAYSVFQLATVVHLAHVLGLLGLRVWHEQSSRGRCLTHACDALLRYFTSGQWEHGRDVSEHDEWWQQHPWLRVAARGLDRPDLLDVFHALPTRPITREFARNTPAWVLASWELS